MTPACPTATAGPQRGLLSRKEEGQRLSEECSTRRAGDGGPGPQDAGFTLSTPLWTYFPEGCQLHNEKLHVYVFTLSPLNSAFILSGKETLWAELSTDLKALTSQERPGYLWERTQKCRVRVCGPARFSGGGGSPVIHGDLRRLSQGNPKCCWRGQQSAQGPGSWPSDRQYFNMFRHERQTCVISFQRAETERSTSQGLKRLPLWQQVSASAYAVEGSPESSVC